jgi:tetratricopeptide (TPR) repeat protein
VGRNPLGKFMEEAYHGITEWGACEVSGVGTVGVEMLQRQSLLAQMRARLERFNADRDPAAILDPAAVADAQALLEMTPDPADDLEVAYVVGWFHWSRYTVLSAGQDQQDLAAALALFAPVYRARPDAIPDRVRSHFAQNMAAPPVDPRALTMRAVGILQDAQRTGDSATLNAAIELLQRALNAALAGDPDRVWILSNLGIALQTRFEGTGDLADLNAAVAAARDAAAAPPDHPSHAKYLTNLGQILRARFERTDDRADIDEAVTVSRDAAAATPPDHPNRPAMMFNLGLVLQARFERVGDLTDVDEAISATRAAVAAAPPDDPYRAGMLTNLGLALRGRFERTGELADINDAAAAAREAADITPPGSPDRAGILNNLGIAAQMRSTRTGNLADLNEAVTAFRAAAAPPGHSDRTGILNNLGVALRGRFERTGELADIDDAVAVGRDAAAITEVGNPNRAATLSNLSAALLRRFERAGDVPDIDEAVTTARDAVAAAPPGHNGRAGFLGNLCLALQVRFERTGNLADINEAVVVGRDAVATTTPGDRNRADLMSVLSVALRLRFERTGDMSDIDEAVATARDAAMNTPADHPGRAKIFTNLGVALRTRFERTGVLEDLDEAVTASRDAVAASPPDHPERPRWLSNLSSALWARFDRTRSMADIDEAVSAARDAAAAVPPGHPDRAGMLANLGLVLQTRFGRTHDPDDLNEAITASRDAVAATPLGHPERPLYMSNLAVALTTRFERTDVLADIGDAVSAAREAAATSPAGHPNRARFLVGVGSALQARFERTGDATDIADAVAACRDAAAMEVAPPHIRAAAGRAWGRAAAVGGLWEEAVAGFEAAIDLLGRVAPRSLARGDQEYRLEGLDDLGSEAAACCVKAGLKDRAVELFEQGRGVLLGQALDTRTDLTILREQYPELAERFAALRDDLARADDMGGLAPTATDEVTGGKAAQAQWVTERRQEVAEAFERVIKVIRAKPGFDRFLRPSPVRDLTAAAAQGPIIVVNVSRFGSYALIVTSGGVQEPIPLPSLTPDDVNERVVGFIEALGRALMNPSDWTLAEQKLTETLGWLWDAGADPVLNGLGITGPPRQDEPWPRLWWCVSGLLSFLPLHAAGHHGTRSSAAPATVVDRVVSSYSPTIRALTHARRAGPADSAAHAGAADTADRVLVVAMPHTPGQPDLRGAQAEAERLEQLRPGQVTVLIGPEATHDAVCAALPAAEWAHFACHGSSDLTNPSTSQLLLADYQQRPLTVADIARLRLEDADLAFLSACSTARPSARLTNEAIHLASAFQLAGYRHVIATLWKVGDQDAVDIAADIYTSLGNVANDVADAAHAATLRFRRRWPDSPSVWASHIHSGA